MWGGPTRVDSGMWPTQIASHPPPPGLLLLSPTPPLRQRCGLAAWLLLRTASIRGRPGASGRGSLALSRERPHPPRGRRLSCPRTAPRGQATHTWRRWARGRCRRWRRRRRLGLGLGLGRAAACGRMRVRGRTPAPAQPTAVTGQRSRPRAPLRCRAGCRTFSPSRRRRRRRLPPRDAAPLPPQATARAAAAASPVSPARWRWRPRLVALGGTRRSGCCREEGCMVSDSDVGRRGRVGQPRGSAGLAATRRGGSVMWTRTARLVHDTGQACGRHLQRALLYAKLPMDGLRVDPHHSTDG